MSETENELNPTLWRTSRVLANKQRLRLLKELCKKPCQTVSALAEKLNISPSLTSAYLRMINSRGLLSVERKNKWVYYSPHPNRTVPWSKDLLNALKQELCSSGQGVETAFQKLTGFTHPRRIEICRILQAEGPIATEDIRKKSNISQQALVRHLDKLEKRKVLRKQNDKYECVKRKDLLTVTLLKISQSKN